MIDSMDPFFNKLLLSKWGTRVFHGSYNIRDKRNEPMMRSIQLEKKMNNLYLRTGTLPTLTSLFQQGKGDYTVHGERSPKVAGDCFLCQFFL